MILLDTSLWIEALRDSGPSEQRQRVADLLHAGEVVFCPVVLAELWNGVRGDRERKVLRLFEEQIRSLPVDDETWTLALTLIRRGRLAGLNIPMPDYLIVACARRHRAGLAHKDAHLDKVMALH